MSGKRLILSALLLALVQIGFLGWMIAGRAMILRDGREVVLKIQPVDPRDFLRGDYIILSYDISRIPVATIANVPPGDLSSDESDLIVRLKAGDDGLWHAGKAWFDKAETAAGPDEVDIRGHVSAGWNFGLGSSVGVDYGIERFYLPEGEGVAIQDDLRERPFSMKVAVGSNGTAQIKALLDGDTTLFEEPLY